MKSLHNLSYKTLFTILFFALAGIVFFLKIGGKTQKVSASWWDDSWHYRQAINISSHNSLESNVYIATSVNIGTTAKAQIDDGDFRFISQSGENLSYYIVSGAGTTNVSFHILIPSFPAGTSTIYAYYGNATADNGFSAADFSTQASSYTIGSLSSEEAGGGPIAYWKFDEGIGTTAYDSSSNKKNGTFAVGTSSPSWVTEEQCISGKCLLFDGNNNQSISLANLISSNSNIRSQGITVQAWVKLTDSNKEMRIISQSISSGYSDISSGGIGIRSNNKASFIAYDDSGSYRFQDSNTTLQTNQWYFITGTFNPSDLKMNIYINGKLDSSSNVTNTLFSRIVNNDYNKIGTIYQNGTNRQFFGYLDETKIYPYARTADQIKQDYNSRGSLSGSSANLGVQSNTAPSLKSSLIAYYKFDEGQGIIVNNSINGGVGLSGIFGTGSSSPTWVQGKIGKGLSFDGSNDYIRISDNASLDLSDNFTVSSWVYLRNQNSSGIIHKGNSTINGAGLSYGWGGNGFMFISWNGSNSPYDTRKSSDINQWHHLVGVVRNGTRYLYVDGNLTSSSSSAVSSWNNSIDLYFGCSGNIGSFVNGIIDEVKIYNTALTADQIKQDYNQGSVISFGSTNQTIGGTTTSLDYCIPGDTTYCAPPVAEWKMDEGIGTSIVDTSGNNNTGTISGATFTQGKIGKSLNLNGTSDYVSIPSYSYTTNATISVWVKGSYANGSQIIIGSPNSISLGIYNVGSSKGVIGFAGSSKAVGIANNFTNDSWNHLTVTLDNSGNATYYCNGQLLPNNGSDYWTWSSGSYIGKRSSGTYFKGQIDNIKIYNYARTPAQVAYDYNKGGPIGWWKMDECQGSIIYDWSGNGNNGTLTIGSNGTQNSIGTCQIGTSAAWTNGATGKLNSSLNFDGTDDRTTIGNPSSLQVAGTKNFSVAAWVYSTQNKCGREAVDKASNTLCGLNTRGGWSLGGNSTSLGFHVSDSINTQFKFLTFTSQLNTWYHLVGVRNGNNLYLYVNGKLNQTGDVTGFVIDDTNNLSIGGNTTAAWLWPGQIDDVRIYNYALTPEQIKQVYNGGAISFN